MLVNAKGQSVKALTPNLDSIAAIVIVLIKETRIVMTTMPMWTTMISLLVLLWSIVHWVLFGTVDTTISSNSKSNPSIVMTWIHDVLPKDDNNGEEVANTCSESILFPTFTTNGKGISCYCQIVIRISIIQKMNINIPTTQTIPNLNETLSQKIQNWWTAISKNLRRLKRQSIDAQLDAILAKVRVACNQCGIDVLRQRPSPPANDDERQKLGTTQW